MPEDKPVSEQVCNLRMDALAARLDGMDAALKLKEREMERRLEGLNELRGDVVRDRDQFVRKDVYHPKVDDIGKRQEDTAKRVLVIETRSVVWTAAIALFFTVVQIVLYFWPKATTLPGP